LPAEICLGGWVPSDSVLGRFRLASRRSDFVVRNPDFVANSSARDGEAGILPDTQPLQEFDMRRPSALFTALVAGLSSLPFGVPAHASTDAELEAIVVKRLHGDATGACFATAVIDGDTVSRAYVCADGGDPVRRIDATTAFEIGSVSKPMMAALLAGLIREGNASLDDPLSAWLPDSAKVPTFEGKPILLRHIVTHTSGLSPIPADVNYDPQNPYAKLTEDDLLGALSRTTLTRAPGEQQEYSNFAAMLLSYGIARRAGIDFETLLRDRVFAPLGMTRTYIARPPTGTKTAIGHTPDGKATSPWDFPVDFAGVGGVRSTLDDMVRYVRGQFGGAPEPVNADFARTHIAIDTLSKAPMAMQWMRATLNGREFLAHEGGTGGFSSFVAFDPKKTFGVVILSDTALHARGGLGSLGLHLLDPRVPLGKPVRAEIEAEADAGPAPRLSLDDLKTYAGDYPLMPGFVLTVRAEGETLTAQATGQGAFPLTPKSKDVFAFADAGIVIRFTRDASGRVSALALEQGGRTMKGQRK
jgi:serine-type D-Ala-D-Ala carboxypeptidase/endopeptidase